MRFPQQDSLTPTRSFEAQLTFQTDALHPATPRKAEKMTFMVLPLGALPGVDRGLLVLIKQVAYRHTASAWP